MNSIEALIQEAVKTQNKILVVDEAYLALDRFDKTQQWITKSSRHAGHSAILLAHNYTDVTKGIRDQCTQIFIFGCSRTDARILADQYASDEVAKTCTLPKLHFARILTTGEVEFGRVDPATKQIYKVKYEEIGQKTLDAEPAEA